MYDVSQSIVQVFTTICWGFFKGQVSSKKTKYLLFLSPSYEKQVSSGFKSTIDIKGVLYEVFQNIFQVFTTDEIS